MSLDQSIVENPMLSINYRIWAKLGYLNIHDNRRYLVLLPNLMMQSMLISYLAFSGDTLIMLAVNWYFASLHTNCLLRVSYTMNFSERFDKFMAEFCILFKGISESGDQKAIETLKRMSELGQFFNKLNLGLGFFATCLNLGYPIVLGIRVHPYALYFFGFDFLAYPIYEFIYFLEILITYNAVLAYIPFCNIFFQAVLFGIALLEILKDRLRNVAKPFDGDIMSSPDNELIHQRLRLNIEYHKRIIRYVEDLNENVSTVFLIEMIIFGIILCGLLFLIQIVSNLDEFLFGVLQCSLILFQLFVLYYLSNELIEQSNELGLALYDSPWYCFSLDNQRSLVLMLSRMQRPMEIWIGNVAPITLQTFQSILNVSYSYFTILRKSLIK